MVSVVLLPCLWLWLVLPLFFGCRVVLFVVVANQKNGGKAILRPVYARPSHERLCQRCSRGRQTCSNRRSSRRAHRTTISFPTSPMKAISHATMVASSLTRSSRSHFGSKVTPTFSHGGGCSNEGFVKMTLFRSVTGGLTHDSPPYPALKLKFLRSTFSTFKPVLMVVVAASSNLNMLRCSGSPATSKSTNETLQIKSFSPSWML